jgi:hypothetical protein
VLVEIVSLGDSVKNTRPVLDTMVGMPTMMSRAPSPVTSNTCVDAIGPSVGSLRTRRLTCSVTLKSTTRVPSGFSTPIWARARP